MCINLKEKQTQQHTDNSTKQENETGKDPEKLRNHCGISFIVLSSLCNTNALSL